MVTSQINQDPYDTQTLVGFLQRPYNVVEIQWKSSHDFNAQLISIAGPNELFRLKSIKQKLANFKYIRAGIRFGIRVNGTKFHYGKIICCWKPSSYRADLPAINDNAITASMYPHVVISATENEVHEFIVPYCLPQAFIDLSAPEEMGTLEIYVLNPLRVNTVTTPDIHVTVFMNLEQVELAGMTTRTYLPSTMMAQGLVEEAIEKSTKEILVGVQEGNGVLSKYVTKPLVDRVARTSAKFINNMLPKSLGFCKPPDLSTWAPRILRNYNLASGIGIEPAPTLGVKPDNMVATNYELVGSNAEEMQISYVTSTPAIVAVHTWGPTTEVFSQQVSPMSVYATAVTLPEPGIAYYHTPLSFTTNAFRYWRGSLKFCIQVTCSAFHSGRLRIFWDPDLTEWTGDVNEESSNCVNHIMDIQSETEYYFTVPYLNKTPWLEVIGANSDKVNGMVYVQVLNNLTHPESPVPPVYINIWMAGGDDYQLAWPCQTALKYVLYDPTISYKAQGLTREQMRSQEYPALVSPAKLGVDHGILMGEVLTNLKEIIMRPSQYLKFNTIVLTGTDEYTVFNSRILVPCFPAMKVDVGKNDNIFSFVDYFRMLYRYTRGSINFKYIPQTISHYTQPGKATTGTIFNAEPSQATISVTSGGDGDTTVQHDSHTMNYLNNGMTVTLDPTTKNVEATIPYYTKFYNHISSYRANADMRYPCALLRVDYNHPKIYEGHGTISNAEDPHLYILKSAGDDFIMGFMVAPPIQFVATKS